MPQHSQKSKPEAGRFMPERSSSPKKIYEYLWMGISLGIIAVTVLLYRRVYQFQTDPYFQDLRKASFNQVLWYGLPIAIFFMIVDWIVHSVFDELCQNYYIDKQKYDNFQTRRKRCQTLVKWGYSMIYYIGSSAWAYKILQGSQNLPSWLGGKGSESLPKYGFSLPQATFQMQIFYIIQFGKHFGRFLNHVFIRREGNFYEYALHHGLSSVLISFSYLTNQWLIGILVLFTHDLSEITLMIGRGYADYKQPRRVLLYSAYGVLIVVWFVCRIYSLLVDCILPSWKSYQAIDQILTSDYEIDVLSGPSLFMIIMMAILLLMQIFWGILIYAYIFTRVYKEMANKPKIS